MLCRCDLCTQIDDVRSCDTANACSRGAHSHADIPQHSGIDLSCVDVDDAERHGETKLPSHFQCQCYMLKG